MLQLVKEQKSFPIHKGSQGGNDLRFHIHQPDTTAEAARLRTRANVSRGVPV